MIANRCSVWIRFSLREIVAQGSLLGFYQKKFVVKEEVFHRQH